MKKLDLNNTVIEVLNDEHGQKVKEFFLKHCENYHQKKNIKEFGFDCSKDGKDFERFYGYLNGTFGNFNLNKIADIDKNISITITRLEDFEPKFPREMYVWDNDIKKAEIQTVYHICNSSDTDYPVVTYNGDYRFAKDIEEMPFEEMTLDEAISEALGRRIKIIKT